MSNHLEALDNKVEKIDLKVNNYIQWRNLKQDITLQGEVLPRLQLLDLRESINGARSQISGQSPVTVRKTAGAGSEECGDYPVLDEALRMAQEQERVLRLTEISVAENFQAARDAVDSRPMPCWNSAITLPRLSQSRHGQDLAGAAEALGRERQRLAMLQNELAAARTRLGELTASLAALNSGKQVPPGICEGVSGCAYKSRNSSVPCGLRSSR